MTSQNFSDALSTWKSIQLSELQRTLDTQGVELVENQKESVVGRKALADKTKEFKKIPEEEKLSAIKGLLKSYQTEIDSLTKRAKTAENAFLNVYKVLAEAPDPYPLLEAAIDQAVKAAEVNDLEIEVKRLRDENAELRRRNSDIASLEAAKKKAETRAEQLEEKMEELVTEKTAQTKAELSATYDERLHNYEEREKDLQRQVALTRDQLRELRTSNESTQAKLLDHSQRQDHEVMSKLAELDMVVADLENANTRVATVERRNELLRAEIETLRSGSGTSDRIRDLEMKVSELEAESARLSQSLETQKATATESAAVATRKLEQAAKDLQNKTTEIDHLRQKMKQFSNYDEIKRELEIMKFVEFAGMEEELEERDESNGYDVHLPDPNADKANSAQAKSLEALLALKNKRILEELTKFRINYAELEESLRSTQEKLAISIADLEKQKTLNEKLENDLLQMDKHQALTLPDDPLSTKIAGSSSHDLLADLDLGKKAHTPSPMRTSPIPFTNASSADASILPIVTSQRDRFRSRNAELEEELRRQFQTISELRAEVKKLQADNLQLYEKVRYMQAYREQGSNGGARMTLTGASDRAGADDMGEYRTRYEEAMNPFQAFRGREMSSAYQRLNPLERGVLILTRGILGNRRTRAFFICYAFSLHLLVMYTTYELSAGCSPALADVHPL